jgi:hypothetical protein
MQNRIASLFELDELLNPGQARKQKHARRRTMHAPQPVSPTPAADVAKAPTAGGPAPSGRDAPAPVAQSFDSGAPIHCQHDHPYRPPPTVDVPRPPEETSAAEALELAEEYTVESFEDSEDDESTLRLADVEAEDRLASREAAPSWGASVGEPDETNEVEPAADLETPASFAAQMNAVERDLADLAARVQLPPASESAPSSDYSDTSEPAPPAPKQVASGHGVFDSMAKGMAYATEFRLPPVQLSQVFSALDRQLDAEERATESPGAPAPVAEPGSAPGAPPNELLLRDLIGMPRAVDWVAPTSGEAQGYAAIDVRHDVQLVPQQTGFSCWAAGAAMLVSWRDKVSVDPSEIARANGYWAQYAAGLHPEDVSMFRTWRLTPEAAQSYTVAGFADLLRKYGPLWVASAEPGPHIRVVTGIVGDGTPGGTLVYISDPWEQGMAAFRLPNNGSRYTETYQRFVEKQEQLARRESSLQGIYVAHN